MTFPALTLYFHGDKLVRTEFQRSREDVPVRASTVRDPRASHIKWAGTPKAFAAFVLEQVAWRAADPSRASEEIDVAKARRLQSPESAPIFSGGRRSAAATLAEAVKAKRSASLGAIFDDWLFVEDAFQKRMEPPAVWLDVRYLAQTNLRVFVDGQPAESPELLRSLARRIEASHPKWVSRPVSLTV